MHSFLMRHPLITRAWALFLLVSYPVYAPLIYAWVYRYEIGIEVRALWRVFVEGPRD